MTITVTMRYPCPDCGTAIEGTIAIEPGDLEHDTARLMMKHDHIATLDRMHRLMKRHRAAGCRAPRRNSPIDEKLPAGG